MNNEQISKIDKETWQSLAEWGVTKQIMYLQLPNVINNDQNNLINLINYQKAFVSQIHVVGLAYLSTTSKANQEVNGVPEGGKLVALRTTGKASKLIYIYPRKKGGILVYRLQRLNEEIELAPGTIVSFLDDYLSELKDTIIITEISQMMSDSKYKDYLYNDGDDSNDGSKENLQSGQ